MNSQELMNEIVEPHQVEQASGSAMSFVADVNGCLDICEQPNEVIDEYSNRTYFDLCQLWRLAPGCQRREVMRMQLRVAKYVVERLEHLVTDDE